MDARFLSILSKAGAPVSGVFQEETAAIVGTVTQSGDAEVVVTAAGMEDSPITFAVPVVGGVAQVETATVVGTITTDGNLSIVVTAAGMTGSPKTVAVAVDNGTAQVETATVVGAIIDAGNISVVVTAAGMTGSPKTIPVAVAALDDQDAIAGKIRTALAADTDVTALFDVTGATDKVVLTRKAPFAANDATLNIATANDTATGLTPAASSADTTPGVAPDSASAVGGKMRAALIADADVGDAGTGFFTVTGAGANIILTAKTQAANDATMNVAIANGTAAGLTAAPTSADTTAGALGDTASEVAAKIRTALEADERITDFFTVGGSSANVVLTRTRSAADDATLNIAVDNDTCAGLTPDATSTTTTAGVHGSYRGSQTDQLLQDTTNFHLYANTGDVNRPVWTLQ